jgi:hypothetical protein
MEALSAPLFEVNPESSYYKKIKEIKDARPRINKVLQEIGEELGFDSKEFAYYGSQGFGFYDNSVAYEKFEKELMKNPDKNGVYLFKKRTPSFKKISPKILELEKIHNSVSPFALHDIFGVNNLKAAQWVGERYFVEVKSESITRDKLSSSERIKQYAVEPVKEIEYKQYLLLVVEAIGKDEGQ